VKVDKGFFKSTTVETTVLAKDNSAAREEVNKKIASKSAEIARSIEQERNEIISKRTGYESEIA
jgi:hypothetical protein